MKLRLAEPNLLKESINIINELVIEGKFKFGNDGIELICMDAANVAMVVFKILKSAFSLYTLEKEEIIGLNLNEFKSILKKSKESNVIDLEYEDNRLIITSIGKTKSVFKLPTLELEEKDTNIKEFDFNSVIKTKSNLLSDAIDATDITNGKDNVGITLHCYEDKIMFESFMSGGKEAKVTIKADKDTIITTKGESISKFSESYLNKFIIAGKLSDEVTINMGTDFLIKIDYKVVDKLQLSFILAPRVENQ